MKLPSAFDALRNTDYRLLWLGAIGAFAGTQMFFLARGYLAYQLTGSAAVLDIVTPEELPKAIALFNSTPMSVRIIAPSLAGALIALPFIGTTYIFYFVLACYLLPQIMLFWIKTPPRKIQRAKTAFMTDFGEG